MTAPVFGVAVPPAPQRPDSFAVVLNMLRETKGGNECRLPTPACWDLARYVAQLEAHVSGVAPSQVPSFTQEQIEAVIEAIRDDVMPGRSAEYRTGYADAINGAEKRVAALGVAACRAEQRGASEWVCNCTQPGPNCKPTGWHAPGVKASAETKDKP